MQRVARSWFILREIQQSFDVLNVSGPASGSLHGHEIFARDDRRLDLFKRNAQGTAVNGVKIKGFLNEQIQGKSWAVWMPERKDGHVLLAPPGLAELRISKGPERHRHTRLKSQALEDGQGPFQIVWFQLDDEVEVKSCAEIAVEHYGDPADHEVPDARSLQWRKNPFDASPHADSVSQAPPPSTVHAEVLSVVCKWLKPASPKRLQVTPTGHA